MDGIRSPEAGLKVLYVDDEPALLELGKIFIESQGNFLVQTASGSKEALHMMDGNAFDAVVSDYQMPEMDGLEFLKQVRRSGNNIPFIIFTGRGREEVAIEALNSGADFYLQKGGNPRAQFAELINMINQSVSRRQQEKKVTEAEINLRTIVDNMGDGLFVVDSEGFILSFNEAACTLSGAGSHEELLGTNVMDFIIPDHEESFRMHFAEILKGGCPCLTRFKGVDLQGRSMWLESANTRILYREKFALLIVFRNIGAQLDMEERLRISEQKYRSIVESQQDLICRFLPDSTITFVNKKFSEVLSLEAGEAVGQKLSDYPFDIDPAIMDSIFNGINTSAHSIVNEGCFNLADGSTLLLEWVTQGIFDMDGSVVEYQAVGRDLTAIRDARYFIGVASKKMKLLCDIARHDVFNRIMVCRGYLELIDEDDQSEREVYVERLGRMLSSMEKDLQFTDQYEKLKDFNPVWSNIYDMVQDSVVSGLKIENDIKNLEIYADSMLDVALQNICTNAEQHGEGAKKMRISHRMEGEDIFIILEDDGVGVSGDMKERIFERCYERRYGYGLFFIREILNITDIAIRETGDYGKGARFELMVPKGRYRFV